MSRPAAGDLASYTRRASAEPSTVEVLGHTAKRVRVLLRLETGVAVRYVKEDRLRKCAGGLLETSGGGDASQL